MRVASSGPGGSSHPNSWMTYSGQSDFYSHIGTPPYCTVPGICSCTDYYSSTWYLSNPIGSLLQREGFACLGSHRRTCGFTPERTFFAFTNHTQKKCSHWGHSLRHLSCSLSLSDNHTHTVHTLINRFKPRTVRHISWDSNEAACSMCVKRWRTELVAHRYTFCIETIGEVSFCFTIHSTNTHFHYNSTEALQRSSFLSTTKSFLSTTLTHDA